MNKQELTRLIKEKKSYLCVGLDTDYTKIPSFLAKEKDPVFEFNKRIIDATCPYAVAYKPNIAFYESMGAKGWESLEKTLDYIPKDIFTIADAKRGDIGNTSSLYARAFFENMNFHSITVAPYMGEDSVKPFLEIEGKWAIILALTSNIGSKDFQMLKTGEDKEELYLKVIKTSIQWGNDSNIMFVVGATKAEMFATIRKYVPDHFLLVPGVGAQGGDLGEVSKHGLNKDGGLLVNSSRGIIYASSGDFFAQDAAKEAKKIQLEMEVYLEKYSR
ncbi:MAG TPA: orotidine-5'-phosphate decarboxylase [Cytophagaceae bacterium]|jgi:orotidine-5'-phosphate decarboxylase|nr:orotidine-5'-phosphate decarboxylase [Cytophagaceae bacterium]